MIMNRGRILAVLLVCISGQILSHAQPDNRYCRPGDKPQFGTTDGPATLPQSCFYTAMSATPSPGRVIRVSAGSDLQASINKARCGETLELAAGATYRGAFNFPAKGCDEGHWITVRTAGETPPEGTRINPCYAGVASLPGRPGFHCPTPKNEMAKLFVPVHESMSVADHYRFIGLEITRPEGGLVYNLVKAIRAKKVIFDRVWMHGTERDETQRGIAIPGASYIAIIDSYFSDLHCIAKTGACVDSQTIWGGVGEVGGGTYKIVNNYLEAAGEGILFGGGAGTATPVDIEIRRNYFYKPSTWHRSDPSYMGIPFIVKNNFELKNGSRVLVEGNVMENSWGGFSQAGFQILLTPKSQGNQCPLCIVKDVTVRYCALRHSGSGMQLASAASDAGGLTQGLTNISIHDVTMEDINAQRFEGNGFAFQISSAGSAYRNLTISHVTVPTSDRDLLIVGSRSGSASMENIVITDNILDVGQYQVASTGGQDNCAYRRGGPKGIFDACWKSYTFVNNVLLGGRGKWPDGNHFAQDMKAAGLASHEGGNLRLQPNSPYHNRSKDVRDVGADVSTIESATAGVAR